MRRYVSHSLTKTDLGYRMGYQFGLFANLTHFQAEISRDTN